MASRPRRRRTRFSALRKRALGLSFALAIIVVIGAYAAVLNLSRPHVGGDSLRFDSFVSLTRSGDIKTFRLLDQDAVVVGNYVRRDGTTGTYNTPLIRDSQREILALLLDANAPITVDQQVGKRVAALAAFCCLG